MCIVLVPLVEHLREFNRVSSKFETWLKEKEAELALYGPIVANLDWCLEQEKILAVSTGRSRDGWVGLRMG